MLRGDVHRSPEFTDPTKERRLLVESLKVGVFGEEMTARKWGWSSERSSSFPRSLIRPVVRV
jgi:hypothetical protein